TGPAPSRRHREAIVSGRPGGAHKRPDLVYGYAFANLCQGITAMLPGFKPLMSLAAACVALSTLAAPAAAEEFPTKPLTFIVPYAPGGPLDGMARLLAEKVQPDLGTVVVENKPGAGGNIGASIA